MHDSLHEKRYLQNPVQNGKRATGKIKQYVSNAQTIRTLTPEDEERSKTLLKYCNFLAYQIDATYDK